MAGGSQAAVPPPPLPPPQAPDTVAACPWWDEDEEDGYLEEAGVPETECLVNTDVSLDSPGASVASLSVLVSVLLMRVCREFQGQGPTLYIHPSF